MSTPLRTGNTTRYVRTLLEADTLEPENLGRISYIETKAENPALRRIAAAKRAAAPERPKGPALPENPIDRIFRFPAEHRRTLTPAELSFIETAARRADSLTLDEAIQAAKYGAVADDDAALKLADLATRPHRDRIDAEQAEARRNWARHQLVHLPKHPVQIGQSDRIELQRMVEDEMRALNPDATLGELDEGAASVVDGSVAHLANRHAARVAKLQTEATPPPAA